MISEHRWVGDTSLASMEHFRVSTVLSCCRSAQAGTESSGYSGKVAHGIAYRRHHNPTLMATAKEVPGSFGSMWTLLLLSLQANLLLAYSVYNLACATDQAGATGAEPSLTAEPGGSSSLLQDATGVCKLAGVYWRVTGGRRTGRRGRAQGQGLTSSKPQMQHMQCLTRPQEGQEAASTCHVCGESTVTAYCCDKLYCNSCSQRPHPAQRAPNPSPM